MRNGGDWGLRIGRLSDGAQRVNNEQLFTTATFFVENVTFGGLQALLLRFLDVLWRGVFIIFFPFRSIYLRLERASYISPTSPFFFFLFSPEREREAGFLSTGFSFFLFFPASKQASRYGGNGA